MEKNNIRLFILLLGTITLFGCNSSNREKSSIQNSFLEVYYLKSGMHFPMDLGCGSLNSPLLSKNVKYKKLNESSFINEFGKEFNSLEKEEYQKGVDTRIKVLYHHNDRVDTICMGEIFFIAVNGELKKDSPKLLQLIKNEIYNN